MMTIQTAARAKILYWTLFISAIIEAAIGAISLLAPETAGTLMRIEVSASVVLLGQIIGWFALLTSAICWKTSQLVRDQNPNGFSFARVFGIWWTAIGAFLAFRYGRYEHLILDSAKGILILWAAAIRAADPH